jgi:hypothetical protein
VKSSNRRARLLLLWVGALALTIASGTGAAESVATMAKRLRADPDFRVRTQAALALGASGDATAVESLCAGLEDSSVTVRAASAAALGRLAKGGKDCLKERLGDEPNGSVKTVITKSLVQIDQGGASGAPAIGDSTKFYVAVGATTDKSGRSDSSVDTLVREGMVGAAAGAGGEYALAPGNESAGDAKKVLKKYKHLKAFYLWPKVSAPEYTGGNLTVRLEVSIFTYPGKSLKAVVPLKLTMPEVSSGDRDSENDLIKMAAAKAFEKFVASAPSIQ